MTDWLRSYGAALKDLGRGDDREIGRWRNKRAENAVARYIDGFYNPVRRHSSLGFQSPIAFERKAQEVS